MTARLTLCTALTLSFLVATPLTVREAKAQSAEADGGLEEIVIKATRREESAQTVPIAVSAFSANQLQDLGVLDIGAIASNIPNVEYNGGIGLNSFNIRGIGSNAFQTNIDSPVAVYVDEVYLAKSFMTSLSMFDLASVEVASGPQGTLSGRNTTAGNVSFYTARPSETFTAGGSVSYGSYQAVRGEGYVGGPLGGNFSGRLSGVITNQNEGFFENVTTGGNEGVDNRRMVRGQLMWSENGSTALLSAHFGKQLGTLFPYQSLGIYTPQSVAQFNPGGGFANIPLLTVCPQYRTGTVTGATAGCVRGEDGLTMGTANPFITAGHHPHEVDNTAYGASFRYDQDFSRARLTSISAAEVFNRNQSEVGDSSPLYDGTWLFWQANDKQYTQELRLASASSEVLKWVVGTFYEHEIFNNNDYLTFGSGETPAIGGFLSAFVQKDDAAAMFGNLEYQVTKTFSLIGGLRFNWEQTSIDGGTCFGSGISSSFLKKPTTGCGAGSFLSNSSAVAGGDQRTDDNVSYKAGVKWTPDLTQQGIDDLMVYGTVSTGFRSGGYNADLATSQSSFTSLSPEKVMSFEVGVKSMFANNRLRANLAIFRYNFKDGFLNVDNPDSPVPITINAAAIHNTGAELNLEYLPVESLKFIAGAGWLDAKIVSDLTSAGVPLDGNEPVNSPRSSFNGAVQYTAMLDSYKVLFDLDGNWRAKQYLVALNQPSQAQDAYGLLNARVALRPDSGKWEVALSGRNLTNEFYRTYVNDLPGFGWTLVQYAEPRTYGVSISAHL